MHRLRFPFIVKEFIKIFPRISGITSRNKEVLRLAGNCADEDVFRAKNIHTSYYMCCYKRKLVESIAVQELSVSALRRLESEVNKFNRAKKSDIEILLKGNLQNIIVKDEESIFLIRCCGALLPNEKISTRINLSNAVWKHLCSSGLHLTNGHFHALLETHIENGNHINPKEFLMEMERLGIEPDRDTLVKLLYCSNGSKDSEETMNNLVMVVEKLKSMGFSANVEMFEALASNLAESGNLAGAEDIVETMIKVHLKPTAAVYTSLIKGYAVLGNRESILKVLDEMDKKKLSMTGPQYASIVSKLAEKSHLSNANSSKLMAEISSILPQMRVLEGENILQCISNSVLELIYKEKENAALFLVLSLPPSLLSGHRFLEPLPILFCKEVVRADSPFEIIIEICDKLEPIAVSLVRVEGFLEPFLLHTVTGLALNLGKKTLSLYLLEALSLRGAALRPHYFWPIMCITANEEDENNKEIEVLAVLKKMISLGTRPDFDTLAIYVLPHMNSKYKGLNALTILKENGVTGMLARTAVTHWLIAKGDFKQAANFNTVHRGKIQPQLLIEPLAYNLIKLKTKTDKSVLVNISHLLHAMSIKGDKGMDYTGLFLLEVAEKLELFNDNGQEVEGLHEAIEYLLNILKVFDENNLTISAQGSDYILYLIQPQLDTNVSGEITKLYMPRVDSQLFLAKSEKFLQSIPHPREMSLEDLENHLLELRAKGFNERGVLRRLFQLHCRFGNFERALKIQDDLISGGHSFSAGMLSSLLDLCIKQNKLEKSREIFQKIRQDYPSFKIDDFKVIDLARLFSRHGHIDDGMRILKEHSEAETIKPGLAIERNIVSLLEAVQAQKDMLMKNDGAQTVKCDSWTVKDILNELVKLGYINNPPPRSLLIKLKNIKNI